MYDVDVDPVLRNSWDPGQGRWGIIALDAMEISGAVPHPSYGAHFSMTGLITITVGTLLLSAMSYYMGRASIGITNMMAVNWGKFVAMAISGLTGLYVAVVVMFIIAIDASASETRCDAVFIISAVFWFLVKALTHLWFNERLYVRRYMQDFEYRRLNFWYIFNTAGLGVGWLIMLYVTVRYYHSELSSPECRIGVTHQSVLIWLVLYIFLVDVYMCISFIYIFPPVTAIMIRRPFAPYLRPQALYTSIYIPPSVAPPKDGDLASDAQELHMLAMQETLRAERDKSVVLSCLNGITSVLPVAMVVFLVYTGRMASWWTYVAALTVDCGIAGLCVAMYESRAWKGGIRRLEKAKERLKKAGDIGMCVECGWNDVAERKMKDMLKQGKFVVQRSQYGVPWDQVDAGL